MRARLPAAPYAPAGEQTGHGAPFFDSLHFPSQGDGAAWEKLSDFVYFRLFSDFSFLLAMILMIRVRSSSSR
jgi:hypothetical protein